jgi:glycosyltransferase involved in cell wall biosynthesis
MSANIARARKASSLAEEFLAPDDPFVTTWHYTPALAGTLTDRPWVVDVYDDPRQIYFNKPQFIHSLLTRVLYRLLRRADRAVHTIHPNFPRLAGQDRRFALNGAATDVIEVEPKPARDPLRCIWVGNPWLDRGMKPVLRAMDRLDNGVKLDVYGRAYKEAASYAERLGVMRDVTFHGRKSHGDVLEAMGSAHVGLSTYPYREDWFYSYPIKIGEYLASGTIPLASDFPGARAVASGAGVYTNPKAEAIAERLRRLCNIDEKRFSDMQGSCRRRAEAISWREERAWFAKQAIVNL